MMQTRSALALAALVGVASCTDLKEYPVTGVTAGYFETQAGAEAATLGSYAGLRGIYGGENEIRLFMVGTDSWEKGEQFDASGAGFFNDYTAQFTSTEGSGSVQGMWQSAYSSINTANTAIAAITSSTGLTDAIKKTRRHCTRFTHSHPHHCLRLLRCTSVQRGIRGLLLLGLPSDHHSSFPARPSTQPSGAGAARRWA